MKIANHIEAAISISFHDHLYPVRAELQLNKTKAIIQTEETLKF